LAPDEWPQTNYSRGNVVAFEPPSHRSYYNADAVDGLVEHLRIKVTRLDGGRKFQSFDAYRTFLASSAIFFNPSYAAPNLQAMIEAQLCGLVVVTTNSHDEMAYIQNGENGFTSNNMEELYAFVEFLLRNPKELRRIGANGRRTAQSFFHTDRFVAEWNRLLIETVCPAAM
jgi:glycosyltransferase involved in cell wall biosynthesis